MKQLTRTVLYLLIIIAFLREPPNARAAEITGTANTAHFPVSVEESEENGYIKIVKTYALKDTDNPADIPTESFEKQGLTYIYSDVIKKELSHQQTEDFKETITITAESNNIEDILRTYNPTRQYNKDGYTGELTLDPTTIKVEDGERRTSSYNVSKTREYPYLSVNDTSLIPKAIEENGRTYSLDSVDFIPQNTAFIDGAAVPDSYKAVATYTAAASSTKVVNYMVSAEYKGQISKTVKDKTYYDVVFMSVEQIKPEPAPELINPVIPPVQEPEKPAGLSPVHMLIAVLSAFLLSSGAFFIGYLFMTSKVKVYNHKDGLFIKIGKVSINYKTNTIELDALAEKAYSDNFVIELPQRAVNKLHDKKLVIEYKKTKLFHTVNKKSDMKKYQFQADFTELVKAVPVEYEEQKE